MSASNPSRSARLVRRKAIVFAVLLGVSLGCMAFSNSPAVHGLQSGVGFAFKPLQSTVSDIAATVGSVVAAGHDMDTLSKDNADLRAENDRLRAENAHLDEIRRENDQLTAMLEVKTASTFRTIARRSSAASGRRSGVS
jgi:cell shape-determining protein MreC